jgi:hypothetical protein
MSVEPQKAFITVSLGGAQIFSKARRRGRDRRCCKTALRRTAILRHADFGLLELVLAPAQLHEHPEFDAQDAEHEEGISRSAGQGWKHIFERWPICHLW